MAYHTDPSKEGSLRLKRRSRAQRKICVNVESRLPENQPCSAALDRIVVSAMLQMEGNDDLIK
jgi:hypothetical protein